MTLKQQNRGIHGGSSLMLSTLVLSNENQACRMWREAPASIGGGGCHIEKEELYIRIFLWCFNMDFYHDFKSIEIFFSG